MQTLAHPRSGATLEGVRLPPGSVIRKDDKYDSSDGKWRTADIIAGGKVPMGDHVVWVRQPNPLSDNGRTLLGYINLKPWGEKTCIGERNGAFYVIPSPTFNWDGRFDIEAKRVVHPECVQELVDHGYLAFSEQEATNWMSDYATVWDGHKNRVYTLTDEGKREGARLLAQ
ncbi:MAG: hypothetical protein Q8R30_00590 [bacterium]|nr:hypothetical protein [bacterium]